MGLKLRNTANMLFSMAEISYVALVSFIIPLIIYSFAVPLVALDYVFWVITGCFIATALWVFVEAIASFVSKTLRVIDTTPAPTNKSVLIIVPAYMDNEQVVLKDTLEAYTKTVYNGKVNVLVVYNVKNRECCQEFETYLYNTWNGQNINGVGFEVMENIHSSSKAENVNHGLKMTETDEYDFIGIYDADHEPEPDNIFNALKCFAKHNCDIVQGQCAIRNYDESFLTHITAMEFTEMYNIGHEGRAFVFGLGLFGGSNGIWKADLLREVKMDMDMLTEDIDSSFRSTLMGKDIRYCAEMVSYEIAPVNWNTLLKQRKRWAQGWLEVSIKHIFPTLRSANLSIRQKVACFLILFWRELFVYVIFHPICLILAYVIKTHAMVHPTTVQIVILITVGVLGLLRSAFVYPMCNALLKKQNKLWFAFYVLYYPFYATVMNITHMATHYRHIVQNKEWVATSRDSSTVSSNSSSVNNLQILVQ